MQYKKITIVTVLTIIFALSYLIIFEDGINRCKTEANKTINIPEIVIPNKSIEFTIAKDKNDNISFIGIFRDSETPKEIVELLDNSRLKHKIKIDIRREKSRETITLIKKILSKFTTTSSYIDWSLVYKDRKLLISGETTKKEDKEGIERLLVISKVDSFNNIKVIYADIVSELKEIVEEEDSIVKVADITPTEDEIKDIISNLKSITIEGQPKKNLEKEPKIVHKKRLPKPIATEPPIQEKIAFERDRLLPNPIATKLPQEESDIDSLPYVEFVETEEPLNIKEHVIDEGTVYIEPKIQQKPDEDIPWAKLHDIDEEVDGIFIPESINK